MTLVQPAVPRRDDLPADPRRKRFYAVSVGLVMIALLSMVFQRFNLGVEFKGGDDLPVPGQRPDGARTRAPPSSGSTSGR